MRTRFMTVAFGFLLTTSVPAVVHGQAGSPGGDGSTPLHSAVKSGDVAEAVRLLRAGANPNGANRYGVAPLSLAALGGDGAIVQALLEAGADPNGMAGEGETVLMSASRAGNAEAVRLLLDRGARVDAREGWQGQTALMWAAAENHPDVVTLLLERGSDPNASGNILEYWAMIPSEQATPKITMPKGGMSALHYAARQGAIDAVRVLASARGIDLDQADPDGINALLYATINGHYHVAAHLLERGANPNVADQWGRAVLFAAVDMHVAEPEPRPPAKGSGELPALELMKLALAKGADPNAPITGRIPNRCPLGCQPPGPEGATPLWRAAKGSDAELVSLLLAAGADPRIPSRDGTTPLMVAAGQAWRDDRSIGTEKGAIATIDVLLRAGLDINEANLAGETALHGAALRGANDVVAYLVDRGARLDAKDRSNRTALDVAAGVPLQVPRASDTYRDPVVREETARVLRDLMTARQVTIEPYTRPASTTSTRPASTTR
jgi:ankyrin repeat protein